MYKDKEYFVSILSDLTDLEKSNLMDALGETDIKISGYYSQEELEVAKEDADVEGFDNAIKEMRRALDGL